MEEPEEAERAAGLRRFTAAFLILGLILALVGVGLAVVAPDAGPDLLRLIWRDPNAPPQPAPDAAAPQYAPYRPPFVNSG